MGGAEVSTIVTEQELLTLFRLKQRAALRRHLRKSGIPFKEPHGVIFTTTGAIDASMVGHAKKKATPNWNAGHASD